LTITRFDMKERDSSSAARLVSAAGDRRSGDASRAETAMAIEFVASLFRNHDTTDSSTSPCSVPEWNVTFPGLSLQPPEQQQDEENAASRNGGPASSTQKHVHNPTTTTRHAAEVHAVTLLSRPSRNSLRENAFASFVTLVNARLKAYVRRWPAVAGLLQYRILPMTLLSRLEVLQQEQKTSNPEDNNKNDASNTKTTNETATTTKLAVCCWSMAMDLILEGGPTKSDASKDGPDDMTSNPSISVSFSTLGSISRGTSKFT
jgi:hypothetical protein